MKRDFILAGVDQVFSLPWLLGISGVFAAFLIPLGFGALSMTKVSRESFRVARACFIASGVAPAITVLYAASQFQMIYWQRVCVLVIGGLAIALPIRYLLKLVNENEKAHTESLTRPTQAVSVKIVQKIKDKLLAWVRAPRLLANALKDNASLRERLEASPVAFGNLPKYTLPVFRLEGVTADAPVSEDNKTITYKNKVRMLLTNVLEKAIQIWTPLWESTEVKPQGGLLVSLFKVKTKDGKWMTEQRVDGTIVIKEFSCLELGPGRTCECWLGLLPPSGKSLTERVRTGSYIGTALFPVKIDGRLYVESIHLQKH